MPTSEVQGPLDFPATPSMTYDSTGDQFRGVGRSRSQSIGESSQGPSFGRRTQSDTSLNISLPMPLLLTPPVADNTTSDQPASAPSPVPTEIIPPELTPEEIVAEIQQSGIKVRDFAYEQFPVKLCAPELFDPILGWHVYESVLENPNPRRSSLNGRHLRRLLDLGWVSEEKDGSRWQQKDREALEKFDSRFHYPWKALSLPKPKKHDLRGVATSRFQWVNAEQLVPQFVNRGISRVAAALRGSRQAALRYQKRDATETQEADSEGSIRSKKRRLSNASDSTPSGSQPTESSLAQFPFTLINGKPPQQFPAGRPSHSPPRPEPLPSQGALSRSLQRHLSMTSVTSPDSRTTLAQGSIHE